jgi:hypothetical protein
MFRREIINIDEFHRIYGNKPGFYDTEYVVAGGDTSTRSFFQLPRDVKAQDVEVLHYYNRSIDAYWVVANNIAVYDGPLPTKHKELPIAVQYQYRVPGRFWGMGIPKVVHMLSEERKAIRRLNLDRQKLNITGAFCITRLLIWTMKTPSWFPEDGSPSIPTARILERLSRR